MRPSLAQTATLAAFASFILTGSVAVAQDQDGPIATAREATESVEARNAREAIAYETPLPRGAPEQDYPLVAWCAALVEGHIALGRTLTNADDLDREIIRLGALEATDFRDALQAGTSRQTPATRAAAEAAEDEAEARWTPLMDLPDEAARSQAFGLFFGLPGRCEHAARRVRENITTPPVTLQAAGLDEMGQPVAP
ncbi:MAG: hypothetical protein IM674_01395 [Brevundimonas sp.]|jgi:hypothetical protein|nr:hypothetical protein [Brevundimonas sp.]